MTFAFICPFLYFQILKITVYDYVGVKMNITKSGFIIKYLLLWLPFFLLILKEMKLKTFPMAVETMWVRGRVPAVPSEWTAWAPEGTSLGALGSRRGWFVKRWSLILCPFKMYLFIWKREYMKCPYVNYFYLKKIWTCRKRLESYMPKCLPDCVFW